MKRQLKGGNKILAFYFLSEHNNAFPTSERIHYNNNMTLYYEQCQWKDFHFCFLVNPTKITATQAWVQCTNQTHTHAHTLTRSHPLSHARSHASFFPLSLTVQVVEGANRPKTTGKLHFKFVHRIVIWITADWRRRARLFLPVMPKTKLNVTIMTFSTV